MAAQSVMCFYVGQPSPSPSDAGPLTSYNRDGHANGKQLARLCQGGAGTPSRQSSSETYSRYGDESVVGAWRFLDSEAGVEADGHCRQRGDEHAVGYSEQ